MLIDELKNDVSVVSQIFSNLLVKTLKSPIYGFYAHILTHFELDYRPFENHLAGVYIKNEKIFIMLNYEFFTLPINQQQGIIKHEVLHIVLKHLTFRKYQHYDHKIWNIATDCAINQEIYVHDLPSDCITISYLKKKLSIINIEPFKSAEYYYNIIIKHSQKLNIDEMFDKVLDEFEISNDDSNTEILKKEILINSLMEKASQQQYYHNSNLVSLFANENYNITPTQLINWKDKVKSLICENRISDYERTFKIRNRRFMDRMDIKGQRRKKEETFNLLLIVDVSGSMNQMIIEKGLAEVRNFLNSFSNINIKMIQVDTEAHLIEDFDKKLKRFNRKSSGGTYVSKALMLSKELNLRYNLVIMISDCELTDNDITEFNSLTKVRTIILKVSDTTFGYSYHSGLEFTNPKIQQFDLK